MVREAYWPTRIPQRCRSTSDPHSQSLWRRFCIRPQRRRSIWPLRNTDASSLSPLCSLVSGLLLRAVADQGMRKKDVVAQLFSHDSDRPARLRPADGTQRRVRLRSALRSKTEFPRMGGRYVRVFAATRATRLHPRAPRAEFRRHVGTKT